MYRLINLLIITICALQTSCKAQNKEVIYFHFENQKEVECFRDKSDKKNDETQNSYSGKMIKNSDGENVYFNICSERFLLVENAKKETVKYKTFSNLKTVDFNYFIKKRKETDMFSKRYIFEKIFFVERINENEYIKYEVYWFDSQN